MMPTFPAHTPLRAELIAEVDDYFVRTGLDRRGGARRWLKTGVILGWAVASWVLMLAFATTPWAAVPLCVSLGLAMACIGFSIMHDGNHDSHSTSPRLNAFVGATLDLLGASSWIWRHKHNVVHHTFTNVDGVDDDIALRPFFRLTEGQTRYWFHRWQHLYWLPLFLFFTTKWILIDDFVTLARGRLGELPIVRPRGWDLAQLLLGKVSFLLWAVILPLMVVSPASYVVGYALVFGVTGVTLGLTFQLAHAVEGAAFHPRPAAGGVLPDAFVEHQLATTVDFARTNRLVTWYVGGLNHQVEHHLFPKIGHQHYPAIATIVREVCARHGIVPLEHATVWSAFCAHIRYMRRLGRPVPVTVRA
jgi:linoleoyl-CoA desaturase